MDVMDQIRAAFARRGHEGYGEGVSQLEHAVQCAAFAERDGASRQLIAAAYLHDIGHTGEQDAMFGIREGLTHGRLQDGDLMAIVAAGIGYVWAAGIVKWGE